MTTRRGLLIQPNGDLDVREITTLDDMYAAIGSDNLDWASPGPLNYICYGYALFELPFNPVATALYRTSHPDVTDPLCGPILAFGPVKDEDETDFPEPMIRTVVELRDEMGREDIARLAVPLTNEEQMDIQMRMMAAQDQARETLKAGRGVDFGGIKLGPALSNTTSNSWNDEVNDMVAQFLFGEQIDGNRRQGREQ